MFVVDNDEDKIHQYTLSESWITNSTSTAVTSKHSNGTAKIFSVKTQDADPQGIAFNDDGLKMYIVGTIKNEIFQYTLRENFDISTASYASKSYDVDGPDEDRENSPTGVAFSNDGLKMFVSGDENNNIYEFTLTENFDISTASFVDAFSVNSQESSVRDVAFDYSGRYMFVLGKTGDDVTVYKLSEPFDVSTAVVQTG